MADPWVQEALDAVENRRAGPGLQRAVGVWAEGQVANILVLPESGEDEESPEQPDEEPGRLHLPASEPPGDEPCDRRP